MPVDRGWGFKPSANINPVEIGPPKIGDCEKANTDPTFSSFVTMTVCRVDASGQRTLDRGVHFGCPSTTGKKYHSKCMGREALRVVSGIASGFASERCRSKI